MNAASNRLGTDRWTTAVVATVLLGALFGLGADWVGPAERWRVTVLSDDLAAVWVEQYEDGPQRCTVPVIVLLKGKRGWLSEDAARIELARKGRRRWLADMSIPTATTAFRAGPVVVPLEMVGGGRRARVWAYNVSIDRGNVLLMSGVGSADIRLRRLGNFRTVCRGDGTPPERLHDYLAAVRSGGRRSGAVDEDASPGAD